MAFAQLKSKRQEPISNYYDMQQELGRGSFSIVYRATHKESKKQFAVKVIDKQKLGPKKLEMIEIEIALMQIVAGHPNIINLEEVFETGQNVYIVMELITGGELFDKIVELQFYSEKEASKLVKQILSAVSHLHSRNIVHRDLKPENLLLSNSDANSSVKLADFGLSTFLPQSGKLKKAVGTPGYIAPEILQTLDEDLDGYGKEVDLWSVGVIMYILLCGFPPFYAEDDDEAFDQIIEGEFEYPDPYWTHISAEAKDLINHLLVVNAAKRYTADQALKHPWIVDNTNTKHLDTALIELKKFNAKKRWKKGLNAVVAIGRMKNLQLGDKKKGGGIKALLEKSKSASSITSLPSIENKKEVSDPKKSPGLSPSSTMSTSSSSLKLGVKQLTPDQRSQLTGTSPTPSDRNANKTFISAPPIKGASPSPNRSPSPTPGKSSTPKASPAPTRKAPPSPTPHRK